MEDEHLRDGPLFFLEEVTGSVRQFSRALFFFSLLRCAFIFSGKQIVQEFFKVILETWTVESTS